MAFDVRKAFGSAKVDKEQAKIVAELGVWAAIVDGDFDEETELAALVAAVSLIPGLEDWGVDQVAAMIEELNENYAEEGKPEERVLEIVQALTDPHLQRCAYQLAALCTAADGGFTEEESEFLQGLQEAFEIPDDVAAKLVNEAIEAL